MKRPFQLVAEIQEKDAEIKRLATEHGAISESRREWMEGAIAARHEIQRLKSFLGRAADALEDLRRPGWKRELIAELRKAAE
jgi:transposase-like protein